MQQIHKLKPIQIQLLRFFSDKNVTVEETNDLQRLIGLYYADKADKLMENIWTEKHYTTEKLMDLLNNDLNINR
jgi:hypothetical protein